jgi:hypothetical protein
VSQVSEPYALSVSPSLNNPAPSVGTDGRLAPLVELLQDQATKHYYHTNDLKDQIASLNSEMHAMFQELKVVIGEQPASEVDMSKFEEALGKTSSALETTIGNLQGDGDGVADLRQKLDAIRDQIASLDVGGTSTNTDPDPIGDAVLEKLETLRMEIKNREGLPDDIVVGDRETPRGVGSSTSGRAQNTEQYWEVTGTYEGRTGLGALSWIYRRFTQSWMDSQRI